MGRHTLLQRSNGRRKCIRNSSQFTFRDAFGHARKKMLLITLLIVACSVLIQNTVALDALIFLKTTDAVDIQALKNVAGVSSVVKYTGVGFFWSADGKGDELKHEWNYMVGGSGFKDKAAQEAFLAKISGMGFVELYAGYRLSTSPDFDADYINDMIKKADPKHFVKRPMKAASPKPECPKFDLKKGERLIEVALLRTVDKKIVEKIYHEYITKVFPALHVSWKYEGQADSSDVWDEVLAIDWGNAETFCEYFQSQFAKDLSKYGNPYKGMAMGFVVKV